MRMPSRGSGSLMEGNVLSWIFKQGIRPTSRVEKQPGAPLLILIIAITEVPVAVRALLRESESVVVIGSDKITKFYHKRVRAL